MTPRHFRLRHLAGLVAGVALALAVSPRAEAQQQQIGALVSPGPLSKAHAKLEGLDNCQKCHEPGKKVTADGASRATSPSRSASPRRRACTATSPTTA